MSKLFPDQFVHVLLQKDEDEKEITGEKEVVVVGDRVREISEGAVVFVEVKEVVEEEEEVS